MSRAEEGGTPRLVPRSPLLNPPDDTPGQFGFFALERDELWAAEEELPETWYEQRKAGPRLKARYGEHAPIRYWALADGTPSALPTADGVEGWYQPHPLMLCLRCRASYDRARRAPSASAAHDAVGGDA